MMPKDEDDFTDLFDREFEAEAFEEGILAIDRAELPACVLAVLDGDEPGPEYWVWMCARAA